MDSSTNANSFIQEASLATTQSAKIAVVPSNTKARLLLWDTLGFSLVAIFLITTFYWIPQITFSTYIFAGITTFTLFCAGIALSWKSIDIEKTKLAYWGIALNGLFVIYVLFSVILGIIAASALSGVDFSAITP